MAIVNDAFGRRFLGGRNSVSGRVGLCTSETCEAPTATMMDVVGVVEDAKYADLRETAPPIVYIPSFQSERRLAEIQVRTSADPSSVVSTLYRALADVDSG